MFENVGGKIKTLVKVMFFLEAIVFIVGGIIIASSYNRDEMIWTGVGVAVVGPLVAWISSLALYAFGELVESVMNINRNIRGNCGLSNQNQAQNAVFKTNLVPEQTKQGGFLENYWTCSRCKRENSGHNTECWYCGEKK